VSNGFVDPSTQAFGSGGGGGGGTFIDPSAQGFGAAIPKDWYKQPTISTGKKKKNTGFGHGLVSDVHGLIHGFVPGLVKSGIDTGHWALHSSPASVVVQAATEGKPFSMSDLLIGRHPTSTVMHVVKPQYEAGKQFWSHPIRNLEQGHILEPGLEALTVAAPIAGRAAAVRFAETPAEARAALLTGKLQRPATIALRTGTHEGAAVEHVVLPARGWQALHVIGRDKALKKFVPANTPVIGEVARATRAGIKGPQRNYLRALAHPAVQRWQKAFGKLSDDEKAAFNFRSRWPLRKDFEAAKTTWKASGEDSAKQMFKIASKPEVDHLFTNPSEKMQVAGKAYDTLSPQMQHLLQHRGALSTGEAEQGVYGHSLMARGASTQTRQRTNMQLRKINARLTRVIGRKKVLLKGAKTIGQPDIKTAVKEGVAASKEAMRSSVKREAFVKRSAEVDTLGDNARAIKDQIDRVMRGEMDTKGLSDLGISIPPEKSSFTGMAAAFTEAEIKKGLEAVRKKHARMPKELDDPNWERKRVTELNQLKAKRDRLNPKTQAPWRGRISEQISTKQGELKRLRGQAIFKTRYEGEIAKHEHDLADLHSGALVDTGMQDVRHEVLGQLADRIGPAYDRYENAMSAQHALQEEVGKAQTLAERQAKSKVDLAAAREKRIALLQQQRAQMHDLLGMQDTLQGLAQELKRNVGGLGPAVQTDFQLPTEALTKYRQYDIPAGTHKALESDIAQHGIREPIELSIDNMGHAHISEGNHRLAMAQRLGHETVPVRIKRVVKAGKNAKGQKLSEADREALRLDRSYTPKPITPDEIRAEIEVAREEGTQPGIEQPRYMPDQPAGLVPRGYAPATPRIGPVRPGGTVFGSGGTLFRTGQFDVTGDVLTQRYMDNAKWAYHHDLHQWAESVARPVARAADLPPGYEWLRQYRGEKIPYTLTTGAGHRIANEEAFDLSDLGEITSNDPHLPTGEIQHDAEGQRLAVPKVMANHFRQDMRRGQGTVRKAIDKYLQTWRRLVLHLRIPWLENNLIGNILLSGIRVAGNDGLRAFAAMVGQAKGPQALAKIMHWSVGEGGLTREDMLDLMPEQTRAGTGYGSQLPPESKTLARLAKKRGFKQAYRIGGAVATALPRADIASEAWQRRLVANTALYGSPEVKRIFASLPKETRTMRQAMRLSLKGDHHLVEQVSKDVNDTLGDYLSLSATERNHIRSLIPFYAWYREITRIALRLPINYPGRTLIMSRIAQIGNEVSPQDVPLYLSGGYPLGGPQLQRPVPTIGSPTRLQRIVSLRSANPLSSVEDVMNAASALVSQPRATKMQALAGVTNPGLATVLQAMANPKRVGPIALAPFVNVAQNLPQYQLIHQRPSQIYPTRSWSDLLLQQLGIPIKTYDVDQASYNRQILGQ